jgi:Ca-activated chloride channel family protein
VKGSLFASGLELLRPEALWWLLSVPLLLFLGTWSLARRRRELLCFVSPRHLPAFVPGHAPQRARRRLLLASAAAGLVALAQSGPVRGYSLREVQRRGLDLVLCVDTSRSMLVQDIKPDRLGRARREIQGLLDRLEGDRVALLAFAGDVRQVAPLTHDRATLGHLVATLSPEDNLIGGTDIGGALEHALRLFDGRTGAHEAIVLLTDGEDLGGRGLEVARRAAERGIRIFVVGMASTDGGKIPDGPRGFVRDEDGREVVSVLDSSTLEEIAAAAGGAYLSAERSPTPLEELYDKRISRLETRELWAGKERIPHDRFQWPLSLALLCMLIETGLSERRGERRSAEVRT